MENQIDGEEIELEESLGVGEQEEEEEADESWNGGRLEENLEKLLEKYANLANDGQTSDDDENDTTDYYSMKIGGRPMPFTLIENENKTQVKNPKEDVLVEKRSIGTITNTVRNEEPPVHMINKRAANTANKFEASLVETRKELDQSAISTTSTQLSKASLNKIYTELNDIHQRLFNEYNIFKRKEKLLKQKELKLKHNEEYLTLVNNELDSKLKFEEIKTKYDQQLSTIREDIRSKVKENKRLYHAFKSIRDSNESLRLKLSQTQEKMSQMERQNSSLNGRLFSLLKKIENENRSETAVLEQKPSPPQTTSTEQQTKSLKKQTSQLKVSQISTLESLANSLEWINETSLRRLDFNLPLAGNESGSITTTTKQLEKIQRILPTVSQYIQAFNSSSLSSSTIGDSTKRYALVFLEFAYLSLLHADVAYQNQKVNLSATFRHIGEEVYKCLLAYRASKSTNYFRPVKEDDKREMATADADHQTINGIGIGATTLASVSCDNKHARILSCLIVLKTLNQVDVLVNVFELLRDDLVDEESKQTFLDLHGTWTVLKFCRLNNHTLLDLAIDIYLQLSMVDSVGGNKQQSDRFIATCSNEYWFSQIALIFRNSNVTSSGSSSIGLLTTSSTNAFLDLKVVEKLCILLQKLSKIRSNRKYFEMFSLNKICSNLLQRFHTESNFLSMNLKSIISNLNGEQIK